MYQQQDTTCFYRSQAFSTHERHSGRMKNRQIYGYVTFRGHLRLIMTHGQRAEDPERSVYMSVLQTIDLKKYYGTEPNITRALDGVSFSVDDGNLWRWSGPPAAANPPCFT